MCVCVCMCVGVCSFVCVFFISRVMCQMLLNCESLCVNPSELVSSYFLYKRGSLEIWCSSDLGACCLIRYSYAHAHAPVAARRGRSKYTCLRKYTWVRTHPTSEHLAVLYDGHTARSGTACCPVRMTVACGTHAYASMLGPPILVTSQFVMRLFYAGFLHVRKRNTT